MGLWKILLGIAIGVCLTESGRQKIIKTGKDLLEKGQCITDEVKEFADNAQSKSKEIIEAINPQK